MSRVLIVGAGLTGSLCACLLRREMTNKVIVVWDKSRRAGKFVSCHQSCYIRCTPNHEKHFYEELLAHGVLKPLVSSVEGEVMEAGHKNYVTPTGVSSIAEAFFNHQVTHIYQKGVSWEMCRKGTATEQFDAVVLTMAVPQILQLQGDVGSCKY
uniref:Renalase, FAD-dependent amine oxidase n=1 Tax=Hucho hucho TaxID=62062 RepID=A0A4W5MNQ6_9TELE